MVLPVEVRDVGRPDRRGSRHLGQRPARDGRKNLSRLTPVSQVVRRPDRDARARREEVVGIALLDDPRVGDARDLPRVAFRDDGGRRGLPVVRRPELMAGAAWSRRPSSSSSRKATAFVRVTMNRWPFGGFETPE